MDYIHLLGSIASIICLGIIFWRFIKKGKISFFNLYMLTMVLIQGVLVGYSLWSHKNIIAIILGCMFLIFTLLCWLVMYLHEKQTQIIQHQSKIIDIHSKMIESESEFTKEINLAFINQFSNIIEIADLTVKQIDIIENTMLDIIKDSHVYTEVKIDVNTKQLESELKKIEKRLRKKIEVQKPTK